MTRRCPSDGPTGRRGWRADPGGGPRAGPDGPRLVRPALRDRRGAAAEVRRVDGGPRTRGRRRVTAERVEVAIVGGGPAGAVVAARLAGGGSRGRRPRTRSRVALAGRRRLHVARRGRRAAPDRPGRGDAARRRPPDPGDARRDPGGASFRLTYGAEEAASRRSDSTGRAGPGAARAGRRAGADVRRGWRSDRRPRAPAGWTC